MKTLDELAIKYGTDKSSKVHSYTRYYQRYFESIRENKLTVLEIGIQEGRSLRMWKEYFPNSTIIGIDNKESDHLWEDRMIIAKADQSSRNQLLQVANQCGPFDIIIDDGSHINKDLVLTFNTLFSFLKPGGFYVAEDLHTCYWGHGFGRPTFIQRLCGVIDEVNSSGKSGLADIAKDFKEGGYMRGKKQMTWWERSIEFMHLYRSIVFIRRYE